MTDSPVGFELSEKEHRIFATFSPGKLCSTKKVDPITAENVRKRELSQDRKPYDIQINDLKDHVIRLEKELRLSEHRSLEMLKKMSFSLNLNQGKKLQFSPFHKSNNISQGGGLNEDSILRSEKKAFTKGCSISKHSLDDSIAIQQQQQPIVEA